MKVAPHRLGLRFALHRAVSLFAICLVAICYSTVSTAQTGARPCDDRTGSISGVVKAWWVKFKRYPSLVYIEEITGKNYKPPKQTAIIDQVKNKFVPHLLPVLAGTTVEFHNSDDNMHTVLSTSAEKYDLGEFALGEVRRHTFTKLGIHPLLCDIHPKMKGFVAVLQNPFFAIPDEKGRFRLKNVPAGVWKIKAFNKRLNDREREKKFSVKVANCSDTAMAISFK